MPIDQIPIGRFSVITRLSQKALRYYDQKKLLIPEAKDPFTGYRYYTGSQIQQGIKIKHLTDLGLSLDEIQNYLEAEKTQDQSNINLILEKRLKEAEQELTDKQRVVELLRKPKEVVKNTMSKPTVKETQPLRVLSKREQGTYEETIGKLIIDLAKIIYSPENQNSFVRITGPFMTIYHDDAFVEEGADLEVAVPISGRISIEDPSVEVRNLKPFKVASLVHKGSYESIGEAYEKLLEFVRENDLEVTGPMMDLYLNDPNTVKPDDILTEIQIPVRAQ
jgi:effector-binding domain-containing protein